MTGQVKSPEMNVNSICTICNNNINGQAGRCKNLSWVNSLINILFITYLMLMPSNSCAQKKLVCVWVQACVPMYMSVNVRVCVCVYKDPQCPHRIHVSQLSSFLIPSPYQQRVCLSITLKGEHDVMTIFHNYVPPPSYHIHSSRVWKDTTPSRTDAHTPSHPTSDCAHQFARRLHA